jgi:hypothetical protein
VSGYEFDVFISYRRKGNPLNWVHNHFFPKLRDCLADHVADEPAVFVDERLETGTSWPVRLENALNRTKVMVAVFSSQYFQSPWCMAEWRSMVEREQLLGLHSEGRPQGLIYPVLLSDSDTFPEFARVRTWRDLKRWNTPEPILQLTTEWVDFHRQVESIAMELAGLLARVPAWQPGWPAHRPDPPFRPPATLPRF